MGDLSRLIPGYSCAVCDTCLRIASRSIIVHIKDLQTCVPALDMHNKLKTTVSPLSWYSFQGWNKHCRNFKHPVQPIRAKVFRHVFPTPFYVTCSLFTQVCSRRNIHLKTDRYTVADKERQFSTPNVGKISALMTLLLCSAQEVLIKEGVLILMWIKLASILIRYWIIQDTFNNVVDWLLGLDDVTACVRSYVLHNKLLGKEKRFGVIIGQLFLWM